MQGGLITIPDAEHPFIATTIFYLYLFEDHIFVIVFTNIDLKLYSKRGELRVRSNCRYLLVIVDDVVTSRNILRVS